MLFARLPDYPDYKIYTDGRVEVEDTGYELSHNDQEPRRVMFNKRIDGVRHQKKIRVSLLLAMLFIPCNMDFNDVKVVHLNGNRQDIRLCNLQWRPKQRTRVKPVKPDVLSRIIQMEKELAELKSIVSKTI